MLGYYLTVVRRFRSLLRVIFFVPSLTSLVAKSMVYLALLAPNGIVNGILTQVGLGSLAVAWFANESTAFPTLLVIAIYNTVAFQAVLFNARLSGISQDIFSAAELDGATHWSMLWRIVFPMTRGYFGVLAMLQYVSILFGSAAEILLLTRGGPNHSTTTLAYLLYAKAFDAQQIGYSQAVGVVLFGIGLLGMFVIRRAFKPTY